MKKVLKKFGVLPLVILFMAFFTQIQNPTFFTTDNLTNVIRQISINGVLQLLPHW